MPSSTPDRPGSNRQQPAIGSPQKKSMETVRKSYFEVNSNGPQLAPVEDDGEEEGEEMGEVDVTKLRLKVQK
jgi:hypothetical protein